MLAFRRTMELSPRRVPSRPAPRATRVRTSVQLSLVVNTRDRGAVLGSALAAFDRLRCRAPWELVLVDNGSSDQTPRLLSEFRDRTTLACTVLCEPRRGSSFAKNTGWRAARGAIVCFT